MNQAVEGTPVTSGYAAVPAALQNSKPLRYDVVFLILALCTMTFASNTVSAVTNSWYYLVVELQYDNTKVVNELDYHVRG